MLKTPVVETIDESLSEFAKLLKVDSFDEEAALQPMLSEGLLNVNEEVSDAARFVSSLATIVWNVEPDTSKLDKGKIQKLIAQLDGMINDQLNEVIHHPEFQELEATWRGIYDLISGVNFKAKDEAKVMIDILDVSKEELQQDFENNAIDFTNSNLHRRIYSREYDQWGAFPFGAIVGMYQFNHTPSDLTWLKIMGKIANASHAPFISSVSPQFFGCDSTEQLAAVNDLEGLMNHSKYSAFNALRDSDEAAYLGLCLPSYILRLPWHPVNNPCGSFNFLEYTWGDDHHKYLWGNSSILFAKNLVRSFQTSGWCQHIRGPKGGGLITGLPIHTFNIWGEEEIKTPVEIMVPGTRELEFANSGFMPLIYRKGSGEACFFSAQSLKKAKKYRDPKDSENAQLVCNLPYTFSITRIAHYVQSIAREEIGNTVDAAYMEKILNQWIFDYVTTITNPDDLTLRRYPFKAAKIQVNPRPGRIGYFDCKISVLPHLQFEGMSVELSMETRLDTKK